MDKQIVIKKYSNRRLYDTTHKNYVTLEDISKLIRGGYEIKVIDSQTDDDITKIILLQVIWEGEKNKQDILPTSFLHMLIKYGNQIAREFFENYFLMMFQPYLSFQEKMSKNFQSLQDFGLLPPGFKMPSVQAMSSANPKEAASMTPEKESPGEQSSADGMSKEEASSEELEVLREKLRELEERLESMDKGVKPKKAGQGGHTTG